MCVMYLMIMVLCDFLRIFFRTSCEWEPLSTFRKEYHNYHEISVCVNFACSVISMCLSRLRYADSVSVKQVFVSSIVHMNIGLDDVLWFMFV
jgi:hypothetical protein